MKSPAEREEEMFNQSAGASPGAAEIGRGVRLRDAARKGRAPERRATARMFCWLALRPPSRQLAWTGLRRLANARLSSG